MRLLLAHFDNKNWRHQKLLKSHHIWDPILDGDGNFMSKKSIKLWINSLYYDLHHLKPWKKVNLLSLLCSWKGMIPNVTLFRLKKWLNFSVSSLFLPYLSLEDAHFIFFISSGNKLNFATKKNNRCPLEFWI